MTENWASTQLQISLFIDLLHSLVSSCERLSVSPGLLKTISNLNKEIISISENAQDKKPAKKLSIDNCLAYISNAKVSLQTITDKLLIPGESGRLNMHLKVALDNLENEVGQQLRRRLAHQIYGLYVIVDPDVAEHRDPLTIAEAALKGGAKILQLRAKRQDKGESLLIAMRIREMCLTYNALFIMNDHADLAVIAEADGLHVGQLDLPVHNARQILKTHQLLGRSNNLLEEALESVSQGSDHVALGPMFPTTTKVTGRPLAGLETLRKVKNQVDVPVVAIGGINEHNVDELVRAGADAICVSSAVGLSDNPKIATEHLVKRIKRAGGKY